MGTLYIPRRLKAFLSITSSSAGSATPDGFGLPDAVLISALPLVVASGSK
jgi:hypothetical protein